MDWLAIYLEEDLGEAGDLTSDPLFPPDQRGSARVVAREPFIMAGVEVAQQVFARCGVDGTPGAADGDEVAAGTALLVVEGPVRGILHAERTALNIIGRMSGIASATRRLQDRLVQAGATAVVAGTRKTTPGFRRFEKEAIRIGGGDPHRMGLYDAMMVKDNHRAAAGDLRSAIRTLRAAHPDRLLEVEVESREDALLAAEEGVDWILIDNQPPQVGRAWTDAARRAAPSVKVEASGGIQPEDIVDHGWADRISLGALTHHAVSVDVGLDWD